MNKLFTKIAGLSIGLAMAIGVGVAVGSKEATTVDAATGDTYAKVTNASDLKDGDLIIFVKQDGTQACGTTQNTNNRTPVNISLTNSKYIKTASDNVQEFVVKAGSTSGQFGFHTGSGYIYSASGSSNNLKTNTTAASTKPTGTAAWTISISSGVATVLNASNTSYYLAFNGTSYFSQYKSGQSKTTIYKKEAVQTWTVSFAVNTAGYGTVDKSSIANVPNGASITTNGNKITINGTTVTATATASTAQYTYAFTGWSNNTGTVTQGRTITANFSRTTNTFTVSGNITHGSLDNTTSIAYDGDLDLNIVPTAGYTYPTSVSITMGGNDISNDVQYEDGYLFYSPVRGNIVITATCPAAGNTYSITTNVTNGTYSGDTSITDNGGVASVTIAPTGDYKLPTSVSVSGADHTYNDSTGVISLSNASGNVTIDASMAPLTEYTITVNETNGSHTGASNIKESRTATLTFTPTSGWGQPADVTVSGATKSWNRTSGVLTLSNPSGNVTVTYDAVGNELTSITLSANSRAYTLGDAFVKPTVTAHYTVADDANVTESSNLVITGYDPYTPGTQPVTFTYTEGGIQKTASYTATVSSKSIVTVVTWNLVTNASDISAGDTIVIAGAYGGNYQTKAMSTTQNTNNRGATDITVSNSKATITNSVQQFKVEAGTVDDTFSFKDEAYNDGAGGYIYAASSSSNNMKTETTKSANSSFTLSISNNEATLTAQGSNTRNLMRYNSGSTLFSCYASGQQPLSLYKKVEQSSGTASLIRIVCDPAIDPATGYKGGEKFVGDKVYTTDFVVKKQYDTGTALQAVTGFTINGGEEVELTSTSNTITVSYTEGGISKSTEVVVAATERAAELESVQLVEKGVVKKSGYIDFASATWNLDNIYVHYYWSDDEFDTEVTLASLVATDDATISPTKPTVGATSFTVSYEYLEVEITNNTITLTEAVRSDYVTSMSWGNTTGSHFKHFSGEQLTEEIVNTWHVKATFAGAGEGERLYWGDYDLYIGSKQITSLPYAWTTADDGEALSIHYGEDVDGNEFVKTNATAVGNVCATINPIDHTETISGLIDKSTGWTTEQSSALSDQDFGTRDLDENISMTGVQSSGSTNVRIYSGTLRTYANNEMYFTPSNGATIKTINLANISATDCSDSEATQSGNVWTIKNGTGTITFTGLNKVTVNADIVVEYAIEGEETTTVHYANQMEHFDAQKKVVEFAKFMNTTMNGENVCSGTFANLESAWETVANKYDELFGESTTLNATELAWAKNMLKYATAAWGSDAENACVEKAMRTYEFCIAKHGVDPFMFESDGTTPLRSSSSTPSINMLISKNSSAVITIIIISAVSLAAVGGYFLFRKKKED